VYVADKEALGEPWRLCVLVAISFFGFIGVDSKFKLCPPKPSSNTEAFCEGVGEGGVQALPTVALAKVGFKLCPP